MTNKDMVVTLNANDTSSAVATANVKQLKNEDFEMNHNEENKLSTVNTIDHKYDSDQPQFKTVKAKIEGEVQEIILARHKYSMEELKASQQKQLELIDKSKMLDVLFHISTAEIFYEAGIELKDYAGNEIPAGTPNVYVPVETADTYYRFTIDDVLKSVEVHSFASVQEFAEAIGTTTLFSRGLSSKEKTGVAALATNDEVCSAIYDLAVEKNMTASTAQLYLDVQVKGATTAMMTTGYKPKDLAGLGRTYEEAKALFERVSTVLALMKPKSVMLYALSIIFRSLRALVWSKFTTD